MDLQEREFLRLRAENLSLKSRVRELEDTLARCAAEGVELRKVLRYYDDAPNGGKVVRDERDR